MISIVYYLQSVAQKSTIEGFCIKNVRKSNTYKNLLNINFSELFYFLFTAKL